MSAHGGSGVLTSTVMQEKAQMQNLNDKLAAYMQRVRALRQAGPGGDPASYHEAMKQLEDEMMKLKNMYDSELDRLRRSLQDSNRQRAQAEKNNEKYQAIIADLQAKLADETNRNRSAHDDMASLQRALADKEKELAELRAAVQARNNELERIKPDHCKLKRENTDLQTRMDQEAARRAAAEDKLRQIGEKSGFDSKMNDQRLRDMQDRLKTANAIIGKLEAKIKQLTGGNDELTMLVQKMRDANAEDLKRYQKETEDALNRSLGGLKNQMENDAREKERLARENEKLKEALRQLHQRVKELEGQMQGQMQQNDALRKELEDERARNKAQLRDLENRARDLQDQLMGKVKDFNQARDAQASLRNEIETYRQLLEAEDIKYREASRPASSRGTPTYGGCNHDALRKSGNLPYISSKPGTGTGRGRQNAYHTTYRASYNSDVFKKDLFTN